MEITFASSAFPPLALGFFGLGTGYLIWGPRELLGWPKPVERVERALGDERVDRPLAAERLDRSLGVWGIWLPGFCQFVTGVILFVGLTWLQVFTDNPALYMAALAFSAYGIHWFAIGWNRYRGNDPRTNAGMCVAFMVISALGATVFFKVKDWPVGLLFLGLFGVYFFEFFATLRVPFAERFLGLVRTATGGWLMYLTYAVVVDLAIGYHWRT
ncbi:MAG TPA: hypothetical protein VKB75_12605 [Jatrophihabitans sp.]|nr:hypothetical protein [Jatrophihabitans sp.]